MDELEKKIKDISNELFKSDDNKKSTGCLGQDILSLYVDGSIDEKEREMVEEHLIDCDFCFDAVLMHKERAGDVLPDVPDTWKESAKNLYSAREAKAGKRFIDIVMKFAEETIAVIMNPGMISVAYGAVPEPVRGENVNVNANLITLNKSFHDIDSEIEVEKAGVGYVNIKVTAKESKSDTPAKGLRISLSNPHRKIASYFAKDGEAYFEGLKYDEYIIDIIKLRDEIGRISLSIKN